MNLLSVRHGNSWRMEYFKPTHTPLTIVCGPAAAGKTHWVAERATLDDLVIDLDVIAGKLSGTNSHSWDRDQWLKPALRERTRLLCSLMLGAPKYPAAYLIAGEPGAGDRQWWADKVKPAAIVVMETPVATCLARIDADPGRPEQQRVWVEEWWEKYERRDGDTIIAPEPLP